MAASSISVLRERKKLSEKGVHYAGCKHMRPVGAAETSLIFMFMTSMSYPILLNQAYSTTKKESSINTKEYIQKNLSYRFVHFQSEESAMIVTELERLIKSGVFGFKPLLNGD